ncbi:substrate-binding periplasmic protein [Aeromonas veronii]
MKILFPLALYINACLSSQVIIGAEDDWYPYSYVDKGGELHGFSVTLVKRVFEKSGVDVIFRPLPFSRCMLEALNGKIIGCFNAAVTEDNRYQYYWHETPIFIEDLAVFSLVNNEKRDVNIGDLEGKRVGIVIGYNYPANLLNDIKIKFIKSKSEEQLIEMVMLGRVDYVLMSDIPGHLKVKKMNFEGEIIKVGHIEEAGLRIAFSKKHPQGEKMSILFEDKLLEMKNDGVYDAMYGHFIGSIGLR